MRIHTNLNYTDFHRAVRDGAASGVWAETFREHGSRKRERAFEVKLTGNSTRRRNDNSGEFAATWDEWGMVLAAIFDADPEATCNYYTDAGDFHHKTDWRFTGKFTACPNHRWEFNGIPREQDCTKCGATRRF